MKNVGRRFGTTTGKQFKQFYQGTSVFFYGTYARFICHTQKVVQSYTNCTSQSICKGGIGYV